MKVLININDEDYINDIIDDLEWWLMDYFCGNSMFNIAVLPKGHGKLIDANQINTLDIFVLNEYGGQFIRKSDIDNIQPIIDGESDGDI